MRAASAREQGRGDRVTPGGGDDSWRMNIGTCHMWAEDGEHVAELDAGKGFDVPVFLQRRLEELGVDSETWAR
jgi:hypothetical protein